MRIDNLKPGQNVILGFVGSAERSMFLEISGEGESRTAKFVSIDGSGAFYTWEAYRYNKRWAYGTSAQRLSLLKTFYKS